MYVSISGARPIGIVQLFSIREDAPTIFDYALL
jgi:hypothetical protein